MDKLQKAELVIVLLLLAACATPTAPSIEVQFTFSPEAPLVHQLVQFSTSTPGPWRWTFGDGAVSAEQNPTHRFGGPKGYTVCLNTPHGICCKGIVVRAI